MTFRGLFRSLALASTSLACPVHLAAAEAEAGNFAADAEAIQPGFLVVEPEIIVTARKRDELLKDVPMAIRVINDQAIEREGIRTVEDLSRRVPGLTFDHGGFLADTRPAIRGMQSERGRPSVAILLDGLDLSGENMVIGGGGAAVNTLLFDLDRIEVVKGPQSVLWGRNAFAGAVNFVSREPRPELEGRLNLDLAEGGLLALDGAINLPIISDRVALRLNGVFSDRNGFYRNPVNNARLGSGRTEGAGGSLLVNLSNDLKVIGRYIYLDQRMSEAPSVLLTPNTRLAVPGGKFAPAPGAPSTLPCPADFAGLTPPQILNCTRGTFAGEVRAREDQIDLSPDPFTGRAMRGMRMRQDIATLLVNWNTGAGSLTYRFGHLDNRSKLEQDGDYSNFPGPPGFVLSLSAFQVLDFKNRTFDHEVRYDHQFDRLRIMVGGQVFDERSSVGNAAQFWLRNPASPLAGPPFFLSAAPLTNFPFRLVTNRKTEYRGIYGSISWDATDRLQLSGDLRWSHETIRFGIPGFRIQDVSLSQLTPVCLPQLANGTVFAPGMIGGPPPGSIVACPREADLTSRRLTPRLTAQYRFSSDLQVYASYSRGFKPGGYNTNEIIEFTDQLYLPERVDAYEAGMKSAWFGNRLVLNASVFLNDYSDQQIGVQQASPSQGGQIVVGSGIVNAGKVEVYGVEIDADAKVADWLRVGVSYAYIKSTFDSFVQGPPPGSADALFAQCGVPAGQSSSDQFRAEAGNICGDFSGNAVGRSPRHALNLSAEVRQPFGTGKGGWFANLDGLYRSARFVDEANLSRLPGYWRVGARAGIEWGQFTVMAYVDNLFDSRTIETAQRTVDPGRTEGFAPSRGILAYLPNPRTFGMRLGMQF
ncbi:MAG: TonB-dependent receptor [Sphingomonadaceae bacterium]